MEFLSENLKSVIVNGNLDSEFPTVLTIWNNKELELANDGTHYGYIYEGSCKITLDNLDSAINVSAGMYFSIPNACKIRGEGLGFVVTRKESFSFLSVGGKVEWKGRLKYIDGCSDSLLISPIIKGYPCMNLLHIPPGINQTAHTHPSVRIGLVISGKGECRAMDKIYPLLPGNLFILPPSGIHSFHTADDELRIVVYHPDSDFGPTDDEHPMINKTYVEGLSASKIEQIKTKSI